jgi:hypothetical protein
MSITHAVYKTYFEPLISITIQYSSVVYCCFFNCQQKEGDGGAVFLQWNKVQFHFNYMIQCSAIHGRGGGLFLNQEGSFCTHNCFVNCSSLQGTGFFGWNNFQDCQDFQHNFNQYHLCFSTVKTNGYFDAALVFDPTTFHNSPSLNNLNFSYLGERNHENEDFGLAVAAKFDKNPLFNRIHVVGVSNSQIYYFEFSLTTSENLNWEMFNFINVSTPFFPIFKMKGNKTSVFIRQYYFFPIPSVILWNNNDFNFHIETYISESFQNLENDQLNLKYFKFINLNKLKKVNDNGNEIKIGNLTNKENFRKDKIKEKKIKEKKCRTK